MSNNYDKPRRSIFDWFTLDVTDLLRAVEQNDPGEVERALRARVNPNKRDGIRRIALPIAVNNNHSQIVSMLLAANASPNVLDTSGESPLYKAVFWDNHEIIGMLLENGASPTFANSNGITPMEEAEKSGHQKVIALLQRYINKKELERIATEKQKHQAIKQRAEAEKKRRIKVAEQERARTDAEKQKEEKKELRQLEQKYGVKKSGHLKGLLRAMTKKDSKATKVFAEKVGDINAYDEGFKTTPLMLAVNFQNLKLASFLMELGADPLKKVEGEEYSPFIKAVSDGFYEFVELTINTQDRPRMESSLNDPDQIMSPQLLCYKDARMFDLLLGAGADPYFGGKDLPAPTIKAIEKATLGILPVLGRHQVDLNTEVDGKALLEWAISFKRIDWVNGLIEEGAEINALGEDGKTALMHAVKQNLPQVVSLLLEAEANPGIKSQDGLTALDMARALGDREEIILLLEE